MNNIKNTAASYKEGAQQQKNHMEKRELPDCLIYEQRAYNLSKLFFPQAIILVGTVPGPEVDINLSAANGLGILNDLMSAWLCLL